MKKGKLLVFPIAMIAGMSLVACNSSSSTGTVSYKGAVTYTDIAKQLLEDRNVELTGLKSSKFKLTGYQQGFDTTEAAWLAGLKNMVNSGEDTILCAGASDLVLGVSGYMAQEGTTATAGGVDSLTSGFLAFFGSGKYEYCDGKYSSMPGPMIAALLRDLEGNKITYDGKPMYLGQGTWQATSAAELQEMIAADSATKDASGAITGYNYIYDEHVVSAMLTMDADTFKTVTEQNDYTSAKINQTEYADTPIATLSKAYKIGMIRNDGTSDESVAFADYIEYISNKLGFTVDIKTTTSGDAAADLSQIRTWASQGYDAVICLSNSDNYAGLKLCADNNMRYCMFAGHPYADVEADMVADYLNYYTGSVGPTNYTEAYTGYKLAKHFIEKGRTKFAMFGGALVYASEMHGYRVAGMLAAMIESESGADVGF